MRTRALLVGLSLTATGLAPVLARAVGPTDVAGVPASMVGQNGPTQNFLRNLDLVGHADMTPPGALKPLGNNGAPALIGDCAYVGRWHDYGNKNKVQIVDITNPATPRIVGGVDGTNVSSGVAREIRAIDLPGFKMLTVMRFSNSLTDRSNNQFLFYTFPSGDCTKPTLTGTFPMSLIRGHEFFQWLDPDPTHNVNGHPRILEYVTAPFTPPTLLVVDASDPANPRLAGAYDFGEGLVSPNEPGNLYLGKYAHSISVSADGTEAYVSNWDGGFFTVDTSDFARGLPAGVIRPKGAMSTPYIYPLDQAGNTHSAVKIPGKNVAVVGDEIYITIGGCPYGYLRTIDLGDAVTAPREIGSFKLEENKTENCVASADGTFKYANVRNVNGDLIDGTFSMHNQTVTDHYVVTSWYGAGVRVIDIADPTAPKEVGAFVPAPLTETPSSMPSTSAPTWGQDTNPANDWLVQMWSYPVIRNGLIYVTDTRNGLYILKPAPGAPFAAEIAGTRFREGNSNLGDLI